MHKYTEKRTLEIYDYIAIHRSKCTGMRTLKFCYMYSVLSLLMNDIDD